MSKFNFSNTLGGAAFGSLNAFLSHNASRDGYSKPNRYEVMIYLPAGVSGASVQDAGESATNVRVLKIVRLQGECLLDVTQYQFQAEI